MYGELLVIFNTLYNYLLVVVCSRLLDEQVKHWRVVLVSICSSICSLWIGIPIIATAIGLFILLFAFASKKRLFRKTLYLLIATFCLGGMLTAIQTYATTTLSYYLAVVVVVLLFVNAISQFVQRMYMQRLLKRYELSCELQMQHINCPCIGFLDTGNQSIEPLTGMPVHYATIELLQQLPAMQNGFQLWNSEEPRDLSMFPPNVRADLCPLFVNTVEARSLVLAWRCTVIVEKQRLENQYVVFVHQPFQFRQQVHIILNAAVLKHLKNKGG